MNDKAARFRRPLRYHNLLDGRPGRAIHSANLCFVSPPDRAAREFDLTTTWPHRDARCALRFYRVRVPIPLRSFLKSEGREGDFSILADIFLIDISREGASSLFLLLRFDRIHRDLINCPKGNSSATFVLGDEKKWGTISPRVTRYPRLPATKERVCTCTSYEIRCNLMRDGPRCSRPSRSRLKGGPSCRNCVDSSKSVDFLPPSPLYTKEEEEEEDRGGEGGATEAALEFIKYH